MQKKNLPDDGLPPIFGQPRVFGLPFVSVLSLLYGLCVFLFFWQCFPCHLHFKEQFQLFLLTKSYFLETCSRPGGFSNYAGRFFTQFYISSIAGAAIISCFLTGIQLLTCAIIRRFREHPAGPLLSFLPSLFYWYLLCDENWQTGGLIALLLTLITTFAGTSLQSRYARRIYLFASIPILYWLSGGAVLLHVILLITYEWRKIQIAARPGDTAWPRDAAQPGDAVRPGDAAQPRDAAQPGRDAARHVSTILSSITALCITISLPFIAKFLLVQYPLSRFWWGVDYLHFTNDTPLMMGYLWILILVIIITVSFQPPNKYKNKTKTKDKDKDNPTLFTKLLSRPSVFRLCNCAIIFLLIYIVILKVAYPNNLSKEEIMAYDYHCRMQNWDEIITMANRKSPTVPMTVTCLNLALYKTGQLPDRMFEYYQNGPEGLLPGFQRDFMIPIVGGEPYWRLGFVNTAQRFAFEAMESFPDYQKSVRSIQRLAETHLVNGSYKTASKYLYLLENTLFYRQWAKATRACLYDEAKIDAHPEWGEIRRFQTDKDFLFSNADKDVMLGLFFQQHPDNRMAYEYLMAYALLTKDIRNFPVYYRIKKDFTYREIPKSWQEALVYIWGLTNNSMDSIPYPVNPSVKQQVVAYANIYTNSQSPETALRSQFSKTYWYYFHFRKYNQSNTASPLQY
jgi:hypothetical protein